MHPLRPAILAFALLTLLAATSRAETGVERLDRGMDWPLVETAHEDLAALDGAKTYAPTTPLPGATAQEDRDLPFSKARTRLQDPLLETQRLHRAAPKTPVEDTAGGDDLAILTSPSIRSYDMEVTADGEIYVAVAHVPEGEPVRVDVLRSTDGGNSWQVWGSRASATYNYDWPSIHVAEGPNAAVYLAYVFYEDGVSNGEAGVIVASSAPDAQAAWALSLAMWAPGHRFRSPDITTDHLSWNSYRVYLSAYAYDTDETSDVWFAVSNDFGASFESYEIGSIAVPGAHYWSPSIAVGWGGYVHVAWYLYNVQSPEVTVRAIRYRRAPNRAFGGAAGWDAVRAITSSADPNGHFIPSVAAQVADQSVVLNYTRLTGSGAGNIVRSSSNSGVDWDPADEWDLGTPYLSQVDSDDGRFYYTGDRFSGASYGFSSAPAADPGNPSITEVLADDTYSTIISTPGSVAHSSPSRGGRFALSWVDDNSIEGGDDVLYFDAEWRSDPGYPNHHDDFPLPLAAAPATPPAIVDVDGDGRTREIVFADVAGDVHVIDRFGNELPGFPAPVGESIADESLAVGDLDGDGKQEIVVGTESGRVFAFRADGSPALGWPVSLQTTLPAYVSIGTVSRLAKRDVVVTSGRQIFLLRPDGSTHEYAPFPVVNPDQMHAAAAIGDLNGDGRAEIVVVGGSHVRVYDRAGNPVWSRLLTGTDLRNTVSLGDIEFDGDLEVVVPTDLGEVWMLEYDGSVTPGWPYSIGSQDIIQEVALADFAVSFEIALDLVFAQRSSMVHARAGDAVGIAGWPHATSAGWFLLGGPVVGGLNSTPDTEITIGDRGDQVHGWLGWIFDMTGWPKDVGEKINLSPAIGDVDADGKNEAVYLTLTELVVLDVDGTPVEPKQSWPMYGHDPQRTSCADCPVDVVTAADPGLGASVVSFAPPSPNPSSGRTTFAYRLPGRAVVRLDVFDLRGRRVRSLLKEEQTAGEHLVSWDGRDANGRDVGAGQYYGRLSVRGEGFAEEATRKMVLVR